jgi:hypothetical protein
MCQRKGVQHCAEDANRATVRADRVSDNVEEVAGRIVELA